MVIRKTILALIVLLGLGLGCRTQISPEPPEGGPEATDGTATPLPRPPSQFSLELSRIVWGFQLDDCRSVLCDIDHAIASLTARTQPDYWASIQERYTASQAQYAKLAQDWPMLADSTDAEKAPLEQRLNELEAMLRQTGTRLAIRDREYVQQRRQYERLKKRHFAELQGEQDKEAATDGCFYADARMMMGLSDMDMTLKHVLVTLEAYTHGSSGKTVGGGPPASTPNGLSAVTGIEDCVSLMDAQGRELGPVQNVQYDRLHAVDGLRVTMAFARDLEATQQPLRFLIRASPLGNEEALTLTAPPDRAGQQLALALASKGFPQSAQSLDAPSGDDKVKVILCQRKGMYLQVPVRLDVHGVSVKTMMVLDTGASVTVLAKSVYHRGVARPMRKLKTLRLKTASGSMTCPVDTLKVSTSAFTRSVPVALTNDSVSLLGANYFAGHRITIDLERECIYVHPKQS